MVRSVSSCDSNDALSEIDHLDRIFPDFEVPSVWQDGELWGPRTPYAVPELNTTPWDQYPALSSDVAYPAIRNLRLSTFDIDTHDFNPRSIPDSTGDCSEYGPFSDMDGDRILPPIDAMLADPSYHVSGGDHASRPVCHVCQSCGAGFSSPVDLEQHAKVTRHRTYRCPQSGCRRDYFRRDVFLRHLATHRSTEVYSCKTCFRDNQRKIFKRKDQLKQHERNCHPILPTPVAHRGPGRPGSLDESTRGSCTLAAADKLAPMACPEICSHTGFGQQVCNTGDGDRTYQSKAMNDFAAALDATMGDKHEAALLLISEGLSLHSNSSTKKLALQVLESVLKQPEGRGDNTASSSTSRTRTMSPQTLSANLGGTPYSNHSDRSSCIWGKVSPNSLIDSPAQSVVSHSSGFVG